MKTIFVLLVLISFFLSSCATSTGTRYGKKETSSEKTHESSRKLLKEDFDITSYKTTIDIEDSTLDQQEELTEQLWYRYPENNDSLKETKSIINQLPGYRVLVYTSDVLEQAEYVKSDVFFKTKENTYLVFEPPFYKVKAGDFIKYPEAADFSFKLSQLGFSESKVIRDTVNIHK